MVSSSFGLLDDAMLAPGQAQAASPPAFRPRVGRRQQGAGPHRHRHHHRTRRQLQNVTSGRSPSPWLVDKLTMTTAMVLLLLHNLAVVSALTCDLCRPSSCSPLRPDCPPGDVVLDVCGCCTVCARQVNESCGGVYGLLGRCADHLECFIAPPPVGQAITGHEEGVCKGESNRRWWSSTALSFSKDVCESVSSRT